MDDLVDVPMFDLPPGAVVAEVPAEPLSRGEAVARRVAYRIAKGLHPLSGVAHGLRLHPDAPRERGEEGPTCGGCRWRSTQTHRSKTYPKCLAYNEVRVTSSEASDVRAWWPACVDYQAVS